MKCCIEPTDLSLNELNELIALAEEMIAHPEAYATVCKGKQLATLFYEPSTRTRFSFTSAMLALGGSVFGFSDAQNSSVSKGETVADTVRVVSAYADIIAMRHFKEGAALVASHYASIPIINAGDGSHSHPTQTLTDLLTIHRELGRLDKLSIGLCGDLKYGRTVHSLIKAMSMYAHIHFVLIAPDNLQLPQYMLEELDASETLSYSMCEKLEDAMAELDVLYMTRVQKERFTDLDEYECCKDAFILDSEKMALGKKDLIVLHPLPRVNEIAPEVDNDPRAAYFRQVRNGKFIRMALMYTLIKMADGAVLGTNVPRLGANVKVSSLRCKNPVCISQTEPIHSLSISKGGHAYCAYCEHKLNED